MHSYRLAGMGAWCTCQVKRPAKILLYDEEKKRRANFKCDDCQDQDKWMAHYLVVFIYNSSFDRRASYYKNSMLFP